MKRLTFTETINAPVKKVWDTMLKNNTYRVWTRMFNPHGSWYVGDIEKLGDIQFLGPDPANPKDIGGMASKVVEVRMYEYIGLEHQGIIKNGETTVDESWKGARENYLFTKKDNNITELTVELDVLPGEFEAYMADTWPKAMSKLKELVEGNSITIGILVKAPITKVWDCWVNPNHITQWNYASDDWECPSAENNLTVSGVFNMRMQAKDGSSGFNFGGVYTNIVENNLIEYTMDGEDKRTVQVLFDKISENETYVVETFDMEQENSRELQEQGWQSILNNFARYCELPK